MKRKDMEREVDKTLLLFDSVQMDKASPFFYTRLKARCRPKGSRKEDWCAYFKIDWYWQQSASHCWF